MPVDAVHRSAFVLFRHADSDLLDLTFYRGGVDVEPAGRLAAMSAISGEEHPISLEELRLLGELPRRRWVPIEEVGADAGAILDLARKGLVVTNARSGPLAELRRREDRLEREQWNPVAAIHHFCDRWRGVDHRAPPDWSPTPAVIEQAVDQLVSRLGPPPPHFAPARSGAAVDLPLAEPEGGSADVLRRRRTTRSFDRSRPLSLEHLAAVLRVAFGCRGYVRLSRDFATLRKTSPSGGAMHPIEAYPLVTAVEGIEPGLYHYEVERHALRIVQELDQPTARDLAGELVTQQAGLCDASALVVLDSPVLPELLEVPALAERLLGAVDGRRPPEPDFPAGLHRARPRRLRHRGDQLADDRGAARARRL